MYTNSILTSCIFQVPIPNSKPNWTALISPFEYPVWLVAFFTYWCSGLFVYWYIRRVQTKDEIKVTSSDIITWIAGQLTEEAAGKFS